MNADPILPMVPVDLDLHYLRAQYRPYKLTRHFWKKYFRKELASVVVESKPGNTCFRIRLPFKQPK
jgi:hypothetical protein